LLAIDWVMKNTVDRPRGIQWTLSKQLEDLDYADNIALLAHSYSHVQHKTQRLQEVVRSTGLEVNVQKTKFLKINARTAERLSLDGHTIEDVDSFTYLGSIVSKSAGTEEDIKARIGKARQAFAILKPIWNNRNIHLNTKLEHQAQHLQLKC